MEISSVTRCRADAFVDALVAAAQQGDAFVRGQLAGHGLREDASLWSQQNDRDTARRSKNGFDRLENRLGLHHHPAAAAVGRIVGRVMLVACPHRPHRCHSEGIHGMCLKRLRSHVHD